MTTYQSQTVFTEDREGNSLAFSTVNQDGEEAVLKAAVDVTLPDGQQVLMNVLYDAEDVAGLLAYLHDNFGGRSVKPVTVATAGQIVGFDPTGTPMVPVAGDLLNFQVGDETWTEQVANVTPKADGSVAVSFVPRQADGPAPGRQCPVIYSGVQCVHEEGHFEVGHHFPGYTESPGEGLSLCNRTDEHHHMQDSSGVHWVHDGTEAACPLPDNHYPVQVTHPRNGAGAVPPTADAQEYKPTEEETAANAAAKAADPQAYLAAQQTVSASTSGEKPKPNPKRKRRLKVEKAYDDALAAYNAEPTAENNTAFQQTVADLRAKDPGNSRLSESTELQQVPEGQPGTPVGFAPEQPITNPFQQPAPAMAAWTGEAVTAHQQAGQVLVDAANNAGYEVPAFQPGQAPELGQVQVSPEEAQAAQGFPCPVHASDGRPCLRPYGHELQTETNPQPKPHVYATTDPSQLGQPTQPQVTDPLPWSPAPITQERAQAAVSSGQTHPVFTPGGPPVNNTPLSFQIPPTPQATVPHPETNLQPPAPAAPSWAEPV